MHIVGVYVQLAGDVDVDVGVEVDVTCGCRCICGREGRKAGVCGFSGGAQENQNPHIGCG